MAVKRKLSKSSLRLVQNPALCTITSLASAKCILLQIQCVSYWCTLQGGNCVQADIYCTWMLQMESPGAVSLCPWKHLFRSSPFVRGTRLCSSPTIFGWVWLEDFQTCFDTEDSPGSCSQCDCNVDRFSLQECRKIIILSLPKFKGCTDL